MPHMGKPLIIIPCMQICRRVRSTAAEGCGGVGRGGGGTTFNAMGDARAEYERLMLVNAPPWEVWHEEPDWVEAECTHIRENVDRHRESESNPSAREVILGYVRDISFGGDPPENWPNGRDTEEWDHDGAGGRFCKFYDTNCHDVMMFARVYTNMTPSEGDVEATFSVPVANVGHVLIGTNHETETGVRPAGAPIQSDGPRPVTEMVEFVLYAIFEDVLFPRAYFTSCAEPDVTASLALARHGWCHGQWFVMRCGDMLHAWVLRTAPPGARLPSQTTEFPTIFGSHAPEAARIVNMLRHRAEAAEAAEAAATNMDVGR